MTWRELCSNFVSWQTQSFQQNVCIVWLNVTTFKTNWTYSVNSKQLLYKICLFWETEKHLGKHAFILRSVTLYLRFSSRCPTLRGGNTTNGNKEAVILAIENCRARIYRPSEIAVRLLQYRENANFEMLVNSEDWITLLIEILPSFPGLKWSEIQTLPLESVEDLKCILANGCAWRLSPYISTSPQLTSASFGFHLERIRRQRTNPPCRPYTHRNPSKDIFRSSPRSVVPKRVEWANHMSLILPMLTAERSPTQCFATFANQIVNYVLWMSVISRKWV